VTNDTSDDCRLVNFHHWLRYNTPMIYTTLISTADLAQHLTDPDWAIFDCRFSLADSERGRRDYAQAHVPGAIYAHLNDDLSGPIIPGVTGRHPLPSIDSLVSTFSQWGIDHRVQVVAYDDGGGGMAARLWWLLRWLGHDAVAVLDGDWRKWQREDRPISRTPESRPARSFVPHPRSDLLISTDDIARRLHSTDFKLFDSRTADRYHGENETIDPIAGHIPGAISAPYPDNLNPDGSFRSDAELRTRFTSLLDGTPAEQTAFYCGSGVTAAQNILVAKHVGLGDAKLYAGSWSEWITNPQRPIEK
jgi:thiosulfate/3-mercaptopyruvate sulfurtransferase